MRPRDFDAQFERTRNRIQRANRLLGFLVLMGWVATLAALAWGLTHPEAIGSFFGRIAAGFNISPKVLP